MIFGPDVHALIKCELFRALTGKLLQACVYLSFSAPLSAHVCLLRLVFSLCLNVRILQWWSLGICYVVALDLDLY